MRFSPRVEAEAQLIASIIVFVPLIALLTLWAECR
jgi:hypothetical protein